ncbi:MAG TPA: T9SS type A sorting domain-containing protein [Bacteroidales bacterium]|nr:T9SS type A sorting domain-containing protein [Bacteroidales bacterium]
MKTLKIFFLIFTILSFQQLRSQYITPGNQLSLGLEQLVNLSGGVVTFSGGTYYINNTLTIAATDTFAIREAATIRVATGIRLEIYGTVISDPAAGKVVFTANDTTTASTNFKGFRFENSQANHFKNTDISYGGGLQLISSGAVFESCVFRRNGSSNVSAVITYSSCNPVIDGCSFIENARSAIGSGANVQGSPVISNNFIYHNTTDNSNRPQINLGPGGADTIYITGNYIEGYYDNVGGIGISNLVGVGNTKVALRNNYIIGNRYGYAQIGNNISGVIEGNELIDNNIQNQPNLGGSGLNFQASGSGNTASVGNNIIRGNLWGVTIQGTAQPSFGTVQNPGGNVFYDNANTGQTYALYNNTALAISAIGNYWGTNDPTEAENNIFHQTDQASLGLVSYLPLMELHPVVESFVFLADENPGLVSNSVGLIDQVNHTVHLIVPSTANISDLIPQITLPVAVTITPEGGVPTDFSNPVTYTLLTPHGESADYTVTVEVETATYSVSFNILDGNGTAVTDAIISFAGVVQPQGVYTVNNVIAGEYPYEVHHPLFETAFGTVNVSNQNVTLDVVLQPLSWTVTFNVHTTDGTSITDAQITLAGNQNAPGDYVFENIVPGTYDYEVSGTGYVTATGQLVVTDSPVLVDVELLQASFQCTFNVSNILGPLPGASVVLNGTMSMITNDDGIAVFDNLNPGTYSWLVSEPWHFDQTGSFEVVDQAVVVDVFLEFFEGISDNKSAVFVISPNPASTFVELSGNPGSAIKLKVINAEAAVVAEKTLQAGERRLDVSTLKPGVYTLMIQGKKDTYLRLVISR